MLSAGIKKTLGSSGKPDNAIVLRMGSDAELGSVIESSSIPLILAAPGVKTGDGGQPLGAAEIVVVGAMEKLGTEGVTNVSIRGVSDDVMKFRPEVRLVAGRLPQPGTDEAIVGARIRGRIRGVDLDQSFDIKKNRPVKVVGIFEAEGSAYESEVWVDQGAAPPGLRPPGRRLERAGAPVVPRELRRLPRRRGERQAPGAAGRARDGLLREAVRGRVDLRGGAREHRVGLLRRRRHDRRR